KASMSMTTSSSKRAKPWSCSPSACSSRPPRSGSLKSRNQLQLKFPPIELNQTNERKNQMNNNNTFEGKVALVTGGTSGIGKATAIACARAEAKVVLSGRREKEGAQVVAEIKKFGGDAAFVRADIAKDADVKAMVKFAVEKFGRLDIAFNNAGVEWKGPVDQATEAEYRRIFDINV